MIHFAINKLLHPLSPGHVGAPLPCNFLKLIDVEEMKYFSAKGEGEVGKYLHLMIFQP